jgi:hypothetical protein
MQKKHHVREFMKSNINIPSGPSHTAFCDQFLVGNPRDNNFTLQAASELPARYPK